MCSVCGDPTCKTLHNFETTGGYVVASSATYAVVGRAPTLEEKLAEHKVLTDRLAVLRADLLEGHTDELIGRSVLVVVEGKIENVFKDGTINVLIPDGFDADDAPEVLRINAPLAKVTLL